MCGKAAHIAYHTQRTVTTLEGRHCLHLAVRRCTSPECPRYHQPYRPEAEGAWALPHGEYGLDVIALVGFLRYRRHQSLSEIHRCLHERGLAIGERTVLNLLARYEELVALHMTDRERLQSLTRKQGHLILAVDGLKPDVGHEVLWVVRDCVSGEILLARPLLSEREADLVMLLKEVQDTFSVPVHGIISDGQHSIRNAVATAFPGVPHQLCHFHYLREAAKPVYEADRHAKKELKKQVRGIRPIEREAEQQENEEATITRKYCLAVRSALTDDGHPPLSAPGLKLYERLSLIAASLERGTQKGGCRLPSTNCFGCSQKELRRQSRCGLMSRQAMLSCIEQRIYWQTRTIFHRKKYNDSMRSCWRRCDTMSLQRPHFSR
jgi:MULE transposase domain